MMRDLIDRLSAIFSSLASRDQQTLIVAAIVAAALLAWLWRRVALHRTALGRVLRRGGPLERSGKHLVVPGVLTFLVVWASLEWT